MSGPRHDPDRGWMSPEDPDAVRPMDLAVEMCEAILDAGDQIMADLAARCQLALDDGTLEVMRDCLTSIMHHMIAFIDDDEQPDPLAARLARLRAGKV